MKLEDDDEPLMETGMMNLEDDDEPLMEMGVLGDKRKHVEGEYISSQAKKACVTEGLGLIGDLDHNGWQTPLLNMKLLPMMRLWILLQVLEGEEWGTCSLLLLSKFMTELLTGDDMGKLGKTKLDKKVKRMEKFGAWFVGYG